MSWERKQFNLTRGYRPKSIGDNTLSSVVVVSDGANTKTGHIRFSTEFETFCAKKMPRGIGPLDPAYVRVQLSNGEYHIYCCYVHSNESVLLWIAKERPSWLREGGI